LSTRNVATRVIGGGLRASSFEVVSLVRKRIGGWKIDGDGDAHHLLHQREERDRSSMQRKIWNVWTRWRAIETWAILEEISATMEISGMIIPAIPDPRSLRILALQKSGSSEYVE